MSTCLPYVCRKVFQLAVDKTASMYFKLGPAKSSILLFDKETTEREELVQSNPHIRGADSSNLHVHVHTNRPGPII